MGCEGSKTKTPPANKDEDLAVVQHDAYLLRLVSARNIPSLDRFSESDVYAIASLMEGGKVVATARWPVKPDSVQPVWDSCRSLGAASSRARVLLQFYDQDEASPLDLTRRLTASSPDFIGEIELGVEDLPNSGEPLTIPLRTKHRPRASGSASCTLSRAPPEAHTAPRQKTLFLIRHGESVWNQAQADKDMVAMLSDVDHPLNQLGRLQAEGLAAHLAAEMSAGAAGAPVSGVMDVEAVLCSPLTRAVQTCLIGLRPLLLARPAGERAEDDVPAAPRIGVVELNPNMREKRNLMGKDSSGAGTPCPCFVAARLSRPAVDAPLVDSSLEGCLLDLPWVPRLVRATAVASPRNAVAHARYGSSSRLRAPSSLLSAAHACSRASRRRRLIAQRAMDRRQALRPPDDRRHACLPKNPVRGRPACRRGALLGQIGARPGMCRHHPALYIASLAST